MRHEDGDPMVEEFGFAAPSCSGPRLLVGHNVGDDGAFRGGLLSAPLPGCCGVVLCCVHCLCGGGVHFGA